jgi:hypothetical protein
MKAMVCKIINYFFEHKHKWQVRGRNRYGIETYRICLNCRKTYKRVNKSYEQDRWEECDPIPDLDSQFDKNDEFIFS